MIELKHFVFNNFGENTYIVYDTDSLDAIVVDPGMLTDSEMAAFDRFVSEKGLHLARVVLTHGHIDHCFGAKGVAAHYGIKVAGNRDDEPLTRSLGEQALRFGMGRIVSGALCLDEYLADGDRIEVGDSHLDVLHVPGHSPGGIALYAPVEKFVIVGDSLFRGSIGRTDLPGGNYATLIGAIQKKLLTLPDDTVVLPGHGELTTIAVEKVNNPYL